MASYDVASTIHESLAGGGGGGGQGAGGRLPGRHPLLHQGGALQVEPMQPVLKAPGTMLFKLRYDEALSNFALDFNLRHYIKGGLPGRAAAVVVRPDR